MTIFCETRTFWRLVSFYNVTLTFDPLTFNINFVECVMINVANFSEIEQTAAEL